MYHSKTSIFVINFSINIIIIIIIININSIVPNSRKVTPECESEMYNI